MPEELKTGETSLLPQKYNYSAADFLTPEPYEKLYELFSSQFLFQSESIKLEENAKAVGFKGFKGMLKRFLDAKHAEKRQQKQIMPNQTEFDDQPMELNCGIWESTDWGIFRETAYG